MGVMRRAPRTGVHRPPLVPTLLTIGVLTGAMLPATFSVHAQSGTGSIRLVLSSSDAAATRGTAGTAALYVKHAAWSEYLAGEKACPGGERTDIAPSRQAETVACLVNFARKHRGLRELKLTSSLNGASAEKAGAIIRCGRFAHNPCGGNWSASIRSAGYTGAFGENLYLASGLFAAPRPTVAAWLNSDAHRRTMFAPKWREQGLSVMMRLRVGNYENVAVWVNTFGAR